MNTSQKKVLLKEALHLIYIVDRQLKWVIGTSKDIIAISESDSQKLKRANVFLDSFVKDNYFNEIEANLKEAKQLIENIL